MRPGPAAEDLSSKRLVSLFVSLNQVGLWVMIQRVLRRVPGLNPRSEENFGYREEFDRSEVDSVYQEECFRSVAEAV